MPGFRDEHRPLDRNKIEQAFDALSERLGAMEVRAHVYIIGGAAMLMAHRRSETTTDVGFLEIDPRAPVIAAAKEVAGQLKLREDWLNDEARLIWRPGRVAGRSDTRREVLYNSPYLVVTGASARHMLATKVRSCRERDRDDIALLIQKLGIRKMSEVAEIYRAVYPHDVIPWRKADRVQEIVKAASRAEPAPDPSLDSPRGSGPER